MMKTAATLSALTALAATTTTTTGNVVVMADSHSYDSYSSYDNKYGGVNKYGRYGGYTDKYGGYDDYGYGTYPKYSMWKPWTWKYKNSYNYYDPYDHHHYANFKEEAHKLIGVQEEKISEDPFDFRREVPGFTDLNDFISELYTASGRLSRFARENLPKSVLDTVKDTPKDRAFNAKLKKAIKPSDFMNDAFQGADDQSLCTCYCDPGKVSIGCTSYFVNDGHSAFHGTDSAINSFLENAISFSALKSRYVPVKPDKSDKFGYDETTFTGISQTIFEILFGPEGISIPDFTSFSLLNLQATLQGSTAPFKAGDAQVTTLSSTSIIWSYQGLLAELFNRVYPIFPFVQTRKYGAPTCYAPQKVLDQCNSVCSNAFNNGEIPENQFSEKCGLEPLSPIPDATSDTPPTTSSP